MGGDVWQWNEANIDDYGRGLRGGNWTYGSDGLASSNRSSYFPADEVNDHGFRVAMVPEPGSIMLAVAGGVCLLAYAWRQRRRLSRPTPMILVAVVVLGLLDSRPALAVNYSAVVLDSGGFYDTRVSGVAGTQQVGEGYMSTPNGDTYHALLWNGASQRVDLNPAGYIGSIGCGTNGTQQVGYGWTNATSVSPHAFLWNGTAQSVVDLTPAGFGWAEAWGIDGTQQIGYGGPTGTIHAMLWSGTAQSAVRSEPRRVQRIVWLGRQWNPGSWLRLFWPTNKCAFSRIALERHRSERGRSEPYWVQRFLCHGHQRNARGRLRHDCRRRRPRLALERRGPKRDRSEPCRLFAVIRLRHQWNV